MHLRSFLPFVLSLVVACGSDDDSALSGAGAGAAGSAGSAGSATTGGAAGSTAGSSGAAGVAGSAAGAGGSTAGQGGSSGQGGSAGTGGAAGQGGSAGSAGSGASGQGGSAAGEGGSGGSGQSGAAGEGGASGQAGGAGEGGSSGEAGASGQGGAGAAGAAGEAGAGGTVAGSGGASGAGAGGAGEGGMSAGGSAGSGGGAAGAGNGGVAGCGTPSECGAEWEQGASDRFDALLDNPDGLTQFLAAVPKGGDLHNHLSGAVYAETYLQWAKEDNDCINTSTFVAVYQNQCSASTQPAPTSGAFFDSIVRAWSMKDFVPGAESGHDHFFATFGKFGAIAGARRNDSIADVAARAASENMLYVETMFNMGKNVGDLGASLWSGTLNADDLDAYYNQLIADPTFAAEVAKDVKVVNDASTKYRQTLGCSGSNPPPACGVGVRFIAQISRTGAKDMVFGQMIGAFEMAMQTPQIVAANLSSPEDDTTSLKNYDLHMAMLDFLYQKYTATKKSPLHITLHAGELTPEYLPNGYANANTFHIRQAVEKGHAERIGHGLDVLSETDAPALLADMAKRKVMVEVCLSSNVQILEVSGPAHPLSAYMQNNVPVALGTDDQGVSRSSMAGEYLRAAVDQKLNYRQLKAMARNSLEHAFLPGESLWVSVADVQTVAACAPTASMGVGDPPNATCQAFLDGSERARTQWELERRFRFFESQQ